MDVEHSQDREHTGARRDVVESEFASVAISIDRDANSPRLRLEDLRTGAVRHVDALELESLVWAPDTWWQRILDPSLHRWRDPDAGPPPEQVDAGPRPPVR